MRSGFVVFLPTVVLLVATTSVAQSKKSDSDGLMARLSYQSGRMIIDWQYQDWRYQKGYPHICFAVYRSGYYRISRLAEYGQQTLEGTLSKDQLGGLDRVLDKIRF